MTLGPSALIIDDEPQIRRFLRITLEANGYQVHEAKTGGDGLIEAATLRPDIILLDWGLPDQDGITILKRLREWTHTPVIMLTVRSGDQDKIAALDSGADDYLTKPFSTGELLARMRVALRHALPTQTEEIFMAGPLHVDLSRRIVTVNDEPIKLTLTEYALLRLLVQNAGRALTNKAILREVWGKEYVDEVHYVRVYMGNLRAKIEADPARPKLLLTEPGVGYRLAAPDA